jgi:hypothetical protein
MAPALLLSAPAQGFGTPDEGYADKRGWVGRI